MDIVNDIVTDIFEINFKVVTDKNEIKTVSFHNLKNKKNPNIDIYKSDFKDPSCSIMFSVDCDSYELSLY